jgi:hypothetical protein
MGLLFPTMTARDTERYIYLILEAARKESEYQRVKDYRNYYKGEHPIFLTHRQEEFLGPLLTNAEHKPAHNLCATVVDVLRERLQIEGFTGEDATGEALAKRAWEWWQATRMEEHQITLHRRALRDGKSYLILDWDAENARPRWVPNRRYDGTTGVTYYRDPETNVPQIACKYWQKTDILGTEHGQNRRTVYLPDRILRQKEDPKAPYGWGPIDPDEGIAEQLWTDNMQYGGLPLGLAVIEFANPGGVSEIEAIIGLQNALNKTWMDAIAAADATGFQLITISYPTAPEATPTDDEDETSDDIQIAPGRALELFDGATAAAIPPGDLTQLLNLITQLTGAIAGVSRTPQYYLRPFGGAEVPSGEALKQLEAALISRAEERFTLFGNSWVDAIRMAAKLYRAMGYADVEPEAKITANWRDPSVRNELFNAQVAGLEQNLGVPQEHLWEERLGYSPEDVEKFKRLNAQKQAQELANVLMSLGNGQGGNGNGNGQNGNNGNRAQGRNTAQ